MRNTNLFLLLKIIFFFLIFYTISFPQTFKKNGIIYRNFKLNPDTVTNQKGNLLLKSNKSDLSILPTFKNDFMVNTLSGEYGCEQRAVKTAVDGRGNRASVWIDKRNDKTDIYAQFFDSSGTRRGSNFKVNQLDLTGNNSPFIAANKNGLFVITYLRNYNTVVAKRFNELGQSIGPDIIANLSYSMNTMEPCAAVSDDGYIMVMWASEPGDWHFQVYSTIIDPSGSIYSQDIYVSEYNIDPSSIGQGRHIAVDSSGNFCLTWSSYANTAYSQIYLQVINKYGQLIGTNKIVSNISNNINCYFPEIAAVDDGTFMVVWNAQNPGNITSGSEGRLYNIQNNFVTPVITLGDFNNYGDYYLVGSDDRQVFYALSGGDFNDKITKIKSNGSIIGSTILGNIYPSNLNYVYPNDISNTVNNKFSISYLGFNRNDENVYNLEFDTTLTPVSAFEKINDDSVSSIQRNPKTAFNNQGHSIILWEDHRNGRQDLYAQLYDENFNPIKGNIKINDQETDYWFLHDYQVKSESDGTFIIGFNGSEENDNDEVYLQAVSSNGEKIGNNVLVKSTLYNDTYKLAMNISDSNEVLICFYNHNGAGFKIYDKYLNPVFSGSNILTSTSTNNFNPLTISVDKNLQLFAVWQYYNYSNQERSKKIYGQFFNKNTSIASNIKTIDGTNSYIYNLKCAHEGIDNYVLVYKDNSNLYIKRNYYSNGNFHFENRDINYSYLPGYINIVRFENKKLFITYNRNTEVKGFYANDNKHSVEVYDIYEYPYINNYYDDYNGVNSADIWGDKLLFTYQSSKHGGTSSDIWANVKCINNINFKKERFFKPVSSDYLYNNYPNPFNSITRINYEILSYHKVKLAIYDILGREVKVLVDENQEKGIYEVDFDGSHLASGVYFYKLDAFDTTIKKMILLK